LIAHSRGFASVSDMTAPRVKDPITESAELATFQLVNPKTILTDTTGKSAFTLTLPKFPEHGEEYQVSFRSTITTLTIQPGMSFQSIEELAAGANHTTSNIVAYQKLTFLYNFDTNKWRIF